MANTITIQDARAWTDKNKLNLSILDNDLEASVATQVISKVSQAYDTSGWTSSLDTPVIIRKLIAMMYVGWVYQRTYSEDEETNSYGLLLLAQAETMLDGIIAGTVAVDGGTLIGGGTLATSNSASFYPTDASSALESTSDDPSLGPAVFSMGMIW